MIRRPPRSTLLSLHDALPISFIPRFSAPLSALPRTAWPWLMGGTVAIGGQSLRSEEHTSELQSHSDLVCRLLLEKKKTDVTLLSSPEIRQKQRLLIAVGETLK